MDGSLCILRFNVEIQATKHALKYDLTYQRLFVHFIKCIIILTAFKKNKNVKGNAISLSTFVFPPMLLILNVFREFSNERYRKAYLRDPTLRHSAVVWRKPDSNVSSPFSLGAVL